MQAYIGFALFALSQPRHWHAVTGERSPSRARTLWQRAFGTGLLSGSLLLVLLAEGPAFGSLLWVLFIGIAAAGVALTLSWRARWLSWLAHRRTSDS